MWMDVAGTSEPVFNIYFGAICWLGTSLTLTETAVSVKLMSTSSLSSIEAYLTVTCYFTDDWHNLGWGRAFFKHPQGYQIHVGPGTEC